MRREQVIDCLRSPQAIRERCEKLFVLACEEELRYFGCDLGELGRVADYVVDVMDQDYPDRQVPLHSRWRHFEAGGVPRLVWLEELLAGLPLVERVRAKFDLVAISVLLDAGAGQEWRYYEPQSEQVFARSEGLAVASFWLFCHAVFSSSGDELRVDAAALQRLTLEVLAAGLQVGEDNFLLGLDGRLALLQSLGKALMTYPQLFGEENPRFGKLVDYLLQVAINGQLAAEVVFRAVLEGLGEIWPGRLQIGGVNLGDVWYHSALDDGKPIAGLVPLHKLSLWLTYSLLEPLQELGLEIVGLEVLTGLAEYRNGGLCIDLGLLRVKQPEILQLGYSVDAEVIVEWRALTVILLDQIAVAVRQILGMSVEELPLVRVLQGGTWSAGRRIASQLRVNGVPPIQVVSDGTVF